MADTLDRFLTADDRAAVRAPIETASPLPNVAYTSREFFALEVERIFAPNWVAIGYAPSVAEPGDVNPMMIFGWPIVLVRSDDGLLRVYHNVGAHDGCPVVSARAAGVENLVGPYHGWVYDLRGRLVDAPYWDGHEKPDLAGLRKRDVDLIEVRSDVWQGIVFVNFSGDAPPLADYLAPMIELFADCDLSGMAMAFDSEDVDGIHRYRARANWKTLWENYAPDVYHENFTHVNYRKSDYVPRVDAAGAKTYTEVNDRGLMGLAFETDAVPSTYPTANLPKIRRKSDGAPIATSTILNMYPNLGFLAFPTHIRVSILVPNEPDDCEWLLASFFTCGAATDPALKKDRLASFASSHLARIEDDRVCEEVQRGRRSPAFRRRFYSPFWESMLYDFNRRVLDDLERA